MSRSRASAKAAGARFERSVADHLAAALGSEWIDRRVTTGAQDRGDIGGVRTRDGRRVVVECKDYGGQIKAGPWVDEAHIEMGNDDAAVGVVVAKRRGTTDPGAQFVLCTVNDLLALLGAPRPDSDL